MNLSWGSWIVIAFAMFAIFIATLVTVCVSQDVNLVSETYYADELVYQQQWQRLKSTEALRNKPELIVHADKVTIHYAEISRMEKAQLMFLRPSDKALDQTLTLPASASSIVMPIKSLVPGMYRVQLSWTQDDTEYFLERLIHI